MATKQRHLSWLKRAVLLDWMMEFLAELGSKRETFANSVNIVDRYLAVADPIPIDQLQCIGAIGMLIASKFEDGNRLSIENFREATSEKYSHDEMLQM